MLRLKWGGHGPVSCQHIAPLGIVHLAHSTRAAASRKPPHRPGAHARRQIWWTIRSDSTFRVDLPLARLAGLRRHGRRLFPLLLPQVEYAGSFLSAADPNPDAGHRSSARGPRVYRATPVPPASTADTVRQSWRKRDIHSMKAPQLRPLQGEVSRG